MRSAAGPANGSVTGSSACAACSTTWRSYAGCEPLSGLGADALRGLPGHRLVAGGNRVRVEAHRPRASVVWIDLRRLVHQRGHLVLVVDEKAGLAVLDDL